MPFKTSEPRHEKRGAWLGAALAFAAVLACSTAGYAQDEAKEKAGLSVWRSSGCSECHGAFANGEKERDEAPSGANLRQTRLDDATIAETVRCGRPGAGMPSFGSDAYKERGCYGQPAGPPPDDLYPSGRTLSAIGPKLRRTMKWRPPVRRGTGRVSGPDFMGAAYRHRAAVY